LKLGLLKASAEKEREQLEFISTERPYLPNAYSKQAEGMSWPNFETMEKRTKKGLAYISW